MNLAVTTNELFNYILVFINLEGLFIKR